MSIRKGNDIIASKPLVDAVPTQDSTNAVSSGGVYDALATKQDTISDLATIRAGAAAGATAVQPATLASYVTLATAQTISGVKTFSSELHSTNNITFDSAQATPIIRGMSGANYRNMIVRTNSSSSIDVGNPNDTINLKGSATNPTYNGNNLALYSDLPTVNNPTITLTQGGVTKGSFTLNQASGDTIDFDAGGAGGYHPDLFDFKWADHICNDVQWLRADTFSWQSGSVYEAAFNDLFNDIYISTSWRATGYANVYTASPTPEAGDTVYSDSACTTSVGTVTSYDSDNNQMSYNSVTWDYNSNSYVTPVSETVAGYSVDVYTGHSGKKIVSWQDESDVASIYSATGVAWYYIIDIANKRFKLPRTQYGVTGLRDTVGNYVTESLPNITGAFDIPSYNTNNIAIVSSGAFSSAQTGGTARAIGYADQQYARGHTTLDASRSSSAYQDSAPVQQRATQMYLYFYVGEFTQTALENTAGITAETLNDKVDVGHQVIEFQAPTAQNNYTWYRKYADGWVEQGGILDFGADNTAAGAALNITLPIAMADNHYYRNVMPGGNGAGAQYLGYCVVNTPGCTTTSLGGYWVKTETGGARYFYWEVKGMAA